MTGRCVTTVPAGLHPGEVSTYLQGAARGRARYHRKHGSPAVSMPAHAPAPGTPERVALGQQMREVTEQWYAEHGAADAKQAHAYGMRALRKWWTDRGMTDRLEAYAASRSVRVRKPLPDVATAAPAAPVAGPVVVETVTVPAPMPRMTRAARKVSNRELAASMRAAGIPVTTETWAAAKAGTLPGLSPVAA